MATEYARQHSQPAVDKVEQLVTHNRNGERVSLGISMNAHARQLAESFMNHKMTCKVAGNTFTDGGDIITEIIDGCLVGKLCDKGRELQHAFSAARAKDFK